MITRINGKIGYVFDYKLKNELFFDDFKNQNFDNFDFINEYKVAESFLQISPFEGKRIFVDNIKCTINNTKINSMQVVVTLYERVKVVEVLLNFDFNEESINDIIFMHHILDKKEASINSDNSLYNNKTIKKIATSLLENLSKDIKPLHEEMATMIEINNFEGE